MMQVEYFTYLTAWQSQLWTPRKANSKNNEEVRMPSYGCIERMFILSSLPCT